MTTPGIAELVVLLVVFGLFVAGIAGAMWLVVRRAMRRQGGGHPTQQQPPSGYWWDGEKWNPPEARGPESGG